MDTGTGISPTVFLLEVVWGIIRGHHPDLPPAVIVVASGEEESKTLKWGHWGATRWRQRKDGARFGEVMIAGEALDAGARQVLTTMLHEGAHAIAHVRQVQDTSRQGRYHNERYKAIAESMGLEVKKDPTHGWTITTLSPVAVDRYADVLTRLEAELDVVRPSRSRGGSGGSEAGEAGEGGEGEAGAEPKASERTLMVCWCSPPRKLRMAPATAEEGPVVCGICRRPFVGKVALDEAQRDQAQDLPAEWMQEWAPKV